MHFKLGELFCGPGGMAIASTLVTPVVSRANEKFSISHSWGVDSAPYAIKTFQANIVDGEGIQMDAKIFVKNELTQKRRINSLAFGFPCNSFSQVGERQGIHDKKFGKLYRTGIRVIEAYDPFWFIAENVSGIKKVTDKNGKNAGGQFKEILQELANAGKGYNVVAHLYKFEEYGVPQARHRYVIVGIRQDIAKKEHLDFKPPAPTHGKGRLPYVTVHDALKHIKKPSTDSGRRTRKSDTVAWRLKFTPPGENAWKLDELVDESRWPDDRLLAYLKQIPWYKTDLAFLGSVATMRAKIEECRLHCQKARMSHIYRRLEANKPAYTLTGSGGGGTHVYHWCEHRALTNEERAALQTFPKDFRFCGTPEQIRKQIGMAVPPQGAIAIFEAILKTFAHVKYKSVDPDPELVFKPTSVLIANKRMVPIANIKKGDVATNITTNNGHSLHQHERLHSLESINESLNEAIKHNPGISQPRLIGLMRTSRGIVSRAIVALVREGRIEHRGSRKTGGYYSICQNSHKRQK